MPKREILILGNPLLWERSLQIDDPSGDACRRLIIDLDDTLAEFRRTHGFGRGIAAPQIGVLSRIIFVRMPEPGFCGALVNPVIVESDSRTIEVWDDCFSVPGLIVRLTRAAKVRVEYLDEQGRRQSINADGPLSELLQHEIDHLDGILMLDRISALKRALYKKRRLKQLKSIDEIG